MSGPGPVLQGVGLGLLAHPFFWVGAIMGGADAPPGSMIFFMGVGVLLGLVVPFVMVVSSFLPVTNYSRDMRLRGIWAANAFVCPLLVAAFLFS